MCILFLYVNNQLVSKVKPGEKFYKLIIASNRDESYKRKTKPACFWKSDPNIVAGQDEEEGGTWLGMNRDGRIGTVLNIIGGPKFKNRQSRGSLVTTFLRSPTSRSGWTYCNSLSQLFGTDIATNFNPFNFLAIDFSKNFITDARKENSEFSMTYITNVGKNKKPIQLTSKDTPEEFFSIGNSTYDSPFMKASVGINSFKSIIQTHKNGVNNSNKSTSNLNSKLLEFLKSSESYFPDHQLEKQTKFTREFHPDVLRRLSSIYVKMPEIGYGTRTHTLILIDSENVVEYEEWTLQSVNEDEIVGDGKEEMSWTQSKHTFSIQPNV